MNNFESFCLGKFKQIINSYCRVACSQVRQQWNSYFLNGDSQINFTVQDLESIVSACIFATGQKAWILEFGKGSDMDLDNPFLKDYIKSDIFNHKRLKDQSMTILGRPEGFYFDLDGNKIYSSGKFEGVSVEWIDELRIPLPAHHIIKNILLGDDNSGLIHQIQLELADVVKKAAFKILSSFPKKVVIS